MSGSRESRATRPPTAREEFLDGIRSFGAFAAGVIPSGLVNGAATQAAGIPPEVAVAMSPVIFAGSAQLILSQLLTAGGAPSVALFAAVIANVRLLLYSLSIARHLEHLPARWRVLLSYLITDTAFATSMVRFGRGDNAPNRHWFLLGAGIALWTVWQASTAVGIVAGALVPAHWALDFIVTLTFISIVAPGLRDRASAGAAAVTAIVAVITYALPYRLGLPLAAISGVVTGALLERHRQ